MIQNFNIGDTGEIMISKMTSLIAAIGSQFIFSVDHYKQTGDPDDTLAFQRCVNDLSETVSFSHGGGIIILAGREYVISGTIIIQTSFAMYGAGSDSGTSITLAAGSDCNMFEIGRRFSSDPISVTMSGIRIQMAFPQAEGFSNIVCYNYLRHSHFIDLFVVHATAPNFDMRVEEGGTPARNSYFYGCAFEYGKTAALRIVHDYNLNINSCYFGFGLPDQDSHGLHVQQTADRFILANSWFLQDSRAGDMFISGAISGHIVNNKFSATSGGQTGSYNLYLGSVNNMNIGGNIFPATGHNYNLRTGNVSNVSVYDNQFGGGSVSPFSLYNKQQVRFNNNHFNGLFQENNGNGTIPNGGSYIDITHSIIAIPDNVIATPQGNEMIWISNIGSSTFRINRSGTSGDLVCNWNASIKSY